MKWLELKVPPVVVLLMCGLISTLARKYEIGLFKPAKQFDMWVGLCLFFAISVLAWAIFAFKKANTTVDPIHPEGASELVTQGVFRYTRNPMYLAMAILLVGAALYLGTWVGFICTATFVGYMTQFQIKPEERIMIGLFGQAYLDYKQTVRRWI